MKTNSFLILTNSEETAARVQSVCSRLAKPVGLQVFGTVDDALLSLEQSPVQCVLVDYNGLTAQGSGLFLQKFRALNGRSATHLVILAQEIASRLLVVGAEFGAFRLVGTSDESAVLKEALEAVVADLNRPSGLRSALMKLSQAQMAGNYGEADRILEDCYQLYRDETDVSLEYGAMCLRKGKLDKATKIADKLSASRTIDIHSLRVSNFLVRVRLKQGNIGGALSILDRANLLSPDNLERLVLLGDVCRVQGDVARAEQSYQRVLELEPNNVSGKKGMGLLALSQGEANRALDFFRECFTEEETGSFFNNTAVLAVRRKQFSKAEKLYSAAGTAFADTDLRSKVAFNMGLMFRRWAKPDKALEKFQEAMSLNPGYTKAADQMRALRATPESVAQRRDLSERLTMMELGAMGPEVSAPAEPAGEVAAELGLFDFADRDLAAWGAREIETPLEAEPQQEPSAGSGIRTISEPVRDVKPFTVDSFLSQTRPQPDAPRSPNERTGPSRAGSQSASKRMSSKQGSSQGPADREEPSPAVKGRARPPRKVSNGPAFIDDDDEDC